jgi:hypothetical protein
VFRISDRNGKAKVHRTLISIGLLECDLLAHKLGQFVLGSPQEVLAWRPCNPSSFNHSPAPRKRHTTVTGEQLLGFEEPEWAFDRKLAMKQILHGCATTTRQSVQQYKNSQEGLRALAKRYRINQKTVAKCKERETVADLPTGPKSTVLSIEEEAIIVAIRLPCRRRSPNGFTRSPERHTEGR